MIKYYFADRAYYLAEDVYKLEPQSFIGCSRTSRLMITKKNIPADQYVFCAWIKSRNVWEPKDPKYNQAKPFIAVGWVHQNLVAFKEEKTEEDLKIEALEAPSILELEEEQLFRDTEGNVIDTEIRGTRSIDNIYFRVKDIERGFGLPNATKAILTEDWMEGVDYKKFFVVEPLGNPERPNNTINLFFTFNGLIRYLYVSRSKNAKHFQTWANKIIFTHQFGSKKEKRSLAASLLGADPAAVKEVFRADARSLPCIYLFHIGSVGSLKGSMSLPKNISDEDIVFKYGFTKDLPRRTAEHQKKFEMTEGVEMKLKYFSYIDPQFCSKAEMDVKNIFSALGFSFKNEVSEELAVIPKDKLDLIEKQYSHIGAAYLGHMTELISKVKEVEYKAQIDALKYQNEIQKLRYEKEILELKLQAAAAAHT